MKEMIIKVSILIIVLMSFRCSIVAGQEIEYTEYESKLQLPETKAIEKRALELINDYRVKQGLTVLLPLPIIKSVAHHHTQHMIGAELLSHNGWEQRNQYLKWKTGATKRGENVAQGYVTVEGMVNAWLNSEGHHKTIVGQWTHSDICIVVSKNGIWWATHIFIENI